MGGKKKTSSKERGKLVTSNALAMRKEMAPHSSVLAWKTLWTEEPWYATVHGFAKSDMTEQLHIP